MEQRDMNQALRLNKLEAHLLKLVIPFVRIAHCSRGRYVKVKGSCIFISADISHSMNKILPKEQNLLPVCLKRKLDYSGNYLEEIIDKNNFFKRYNLLFNTVGLHEKAMDDYEEECVAAAKEFDEINNTRENEKNKNLNEEENLKSDLDSSEDEFNLDENTFCNPTEEQKNEETKFFRDQSSIFCNKYEEDVNVSTVASKLANMITEAEIHYAVDIEDELENEDLEEFPEAENEWNLSENDIFVEDEFLNEDDFFEEIQEDLATEMHQQSNRNVKRTLDRVSKISVAPGETGKFKNWGDDVFLEEKCFPELFPFGIGGYLSSLMKSKEKSIGFAAYVKSRMMSADPKYRSNSTYLFFLLIVKELVQLKRCKQTYMRQATKLPNMTKATMKHIKREDLSRYNRSYEVFKAMRGTSMYYEEAKRNVMAILRQNGSPTLFVTLSCAEYSWEGLLKEILETVQNRVVTLDEVKKLTPQEKNQLISENVVQSTLHFQKRIEKELRLMTYPEFFEDELHYKVSSYYYRVEFQQRGAPHIHCLLWLQDSEGKAAPTFWSTDENRSEEENSTKINDIEKIASSIISASEDSALCDKHNKERQKTKRNQENCLNCYSPYSNFVECEEHKIEDNQTECEKCNILKQAVKDFQTHSHTFTCQKNNKMILIVLWVIKILKSVL